jgi:hypothetical protein
MATMKQLEANRRNGQLSTGPRTAEGKDRSSSNAIKHGLAGERWLLIDEDPEAFDNLWQAAWDYYQPVGLEVELLERAVGLLWRLRRAAVFEAMLINAKTEAEAGDPTRNLKLFPNQPDTCPIAGALESILHDDLLNRLGRYERNFHNQLLATFKQLKDIRVDRMSQMSLLAPDTAQASAG